MNILLVTTDFLPNVSGIATLSYEHAAGLGQLGHTVTVLTLANAANLELPNQNFEVSYVNHSGRSKLRLLSLYRALSDAARAYKPDFIWCSNYRGFGLPVMLVARRNNIRYGIYFHGTELLTESKTWLRKTILGLVAKQSGLTCTNSTNSKELLKRIYKASAYDLTPGVHRVEADNPKFSHTSREIRSSWLDSLEVSDDPFLFVATCRISRQKGLFTILDSFRLLPARLRERAAFIAAGTGPDLEALKELTIARGLEKKVLFMGAVEREQIPYVLKAGNCYLQPSEPEGLFLESFGISFLEAQSVGLPCIATRWGGIPEAVKEGITSILVNPGDSTQVAAAMEKAMTDKKWVALAAVHGPIWASENTWHKHTARLNNLING